MFSWFIKLNNRIIRIIYQLSFTFQFSFIRQAVVHKRHEETQIDPQNYVFNHLFVRMKYRTIFSLRSLISTAFK